MSSCRTLDPPTLDPPPPSPPSHGQSYDWERASCMLRSVSGLFDSVEFYCQVSHLCLVDAGGGGAWRVAQLEGSFGWGVRNRTPAEPNVRTHQGQNWSRQKSTLPLSSKFINGKNVLQCLVIRTEIAPASYRRLHDSKLLVRSSSNLVHWPVIILLKGLVECIACFRCRSLSLGPFWFLACHNPFS